MRGLAVLAGLALAVGMPALATQDTISWAPDTVPSVVNPSRNVSSSAWESYKARPGKPSVDQELDDPILKGAIDIHAHYGPDTYNRQWDVFEIARRAQAHGMRGMVFKSHWSETAGIAQLAHEYAAPGLEEWGGLALNTSVGGINPMAVRVFAEMEGHRGKIVWMPTHDSEHEVKALGETRPYVRVSADGKLLPQVLEVLDLIKFYDLTLATGHVSPTEMLQIVAAAHERGISRIVITHPGLGPQFTDPSIDQLKQVVRQGAYAEVVASELFGQGRAKAVAMMKAIGPEHCIVSTDSGLVGTPNHTDALVLAARILREEGFAEKDLDPMFKTNPARVLGLAPA